MIAAVPSFWTLLEALSVRFWQGAVLFANAGIAMAEACCCDTDPPPDDECVGLACCCFHDNVKIDIAWDMGGPSVQDQVSDCDRPCPLPECGSLISGSITFEGRHLLGWGGQGCYTKDGKECVQVREEDAGVQYRMNFGCRDGFGTDITFYVRRVEWCPFTEDFRTVCFYSMRVQPGDNYIQNDHCCRVEFSSFGSDGDNGTVQLREHDLDIDHEEESCLRERCCVEPEAFYRPDASLTVDIYNNRCCAHYDHMDRQQCRGSATDMGSQCTSQGHPLEVPINLCPED